MSVKEIVGNSVISELVKERKLSTALLEMGIKSGILTDISEVMTSPERLLEASDDYNRKSPDFDGIIHTETEESTRPSRFTKTKRDKFIIPFLEFLNTKTNNEVVSYATLATKFKIDYGHAHAVVNLALKPNINCFVFDVDYGTQQTRGILSIEAAVEPRSMKLGSKMVMFALRKYPMINWDEEALSIFLDKTVEEIISYVKHLREGEDFERTEVRQSKVCLRAI